MDTRLKYVKLKSRITRTPINQIENWEANKFYVASGEEFDGAAYETIYNVNTTEADDLRIAKRVELLKEGEYLEVFHTGEETYAYSIRQKGESA